MIRPRLYLFNTNTGRWHQLQLPVMEWLEKAKPKRRVHGGVWGFTGIKLSNVGDSYLWNITSDICRMGLVWIWLLTTNKVCSSHNVLSVRVFFIQSRRIDHKHGQVLALMQMHPKESLGRVIHDSKVVWCLKCGMLILSVPLATVICQWLIE